MGLMGYAKAKTVVALLFLSAYDEDNFNMRRRDGKFTEA